MDENKEVVSLHVKEMTETMGWRIVKEFLNERIIDAQNRLTTVDPKDTIKIAEYQSVIKNYNLLLSTIKNYINKK